MTTSAQLHTTRPDYVTRVQPVPALGAGLAAGAALLALYYITLGLLPLATAYPTTLFPLSIWAHRLDLAQWIGTIALPPYPTPRTWEVGVILWIGVLAGAGLAYALLLAWSLQVSTAAKGLGYGVLLSLTWAAALTLAQGNHPAVMRNALPDVGVLMLGWSAWAALQLLTVYALYGLLLGALYRRWTRP